MRTQNMIPKDELSNLVYNEIDWLYKKLDALWVKEELNETEATDNNNEQEMLKHYARKILINIAQSAIELTTNEIKERLK